jgi:DNA/RNA endonuclease G (NUC1)
MPIKVLEWLVGLKGKLDGQHLVILTLICAYFAKQYVDAQDEKTFDRGHQARMFLKADMDAQFKATMLVLADIKKTVEGTDNRVWELMKERRHAELKEKSRYGKQEAMVVEDPLERPDRRDRGILSARE